MTWCFVLFYSFFKPLTRPFAYNATFLVVRIVQGNLLPDYQSSVLTQIHCTNSNFTAGSNRWTGRSQTGELGSAQDGVSAGGSDEYVPWGRPTGGECWWWVWGRRTAWRWWPLARPAVTGDCPVRSEITPANCVCQISSQATCYLKAYKNVCEREREGEGGEREVSFTYSNRFKFALSLQ